MRIEKNLNIKKLKSNQVEKKTNLFKLKKLLFNHRFQSRQTLSLNPINFLTVVTFLPFALGFAGFVSKKSILEKSEGFFDKNLPAFTFLKTKIDFETFEYIYKSNSLDIDQKNFKILLFKENSEKKFVFGQPKFISKIKHSRFFPEASFTGLSCQFYDTRLGTPSLFSKNLDELPSYLKSVSPKQENLLSLADKFRFFSKEKSSQTKPLLSLNTLKQKKKFDTTNLFLSVPREKNLILINKFHKKLASFPPLDTTGSGNDITKNRLNLKLNQKKPTRLQKFLHEFSDVDETFFLEQILQDLNKKRISDEVLGFRIMSGYSYPDMTISYLNCFSFQKFFFRKSISQGLKLEKSQLPVFSKKYNFSLNNFPAVVIETKKISLKNLDQNRIFYNGPALLLDSHKAFDWINQNREQINNQQDSTLSLRQKDNLRFWFHLYLSPYNPLVRLQENFFGVYNSPEFLINGKSSDFSKFANKSLLHLTDHNDGSSLDLFSLTGNFAPFNYSLHIPTEISDKNKFLSENQKSFFIRGVDLNLSQQENSNNLQQFVPLIQLKQPQFKSLPTNGFHYSSPLFETSLIGNLDYTIPKDFLNQTGFVQKTFSGRYQKISSVFSKTTKSSYALVDNWEPLTPYSWLVVSQLSFAIFIFYTLKNLADNYGRELLSYLLDLVSALGVLDDSLKQEIEILMGQREKGFRIILKSRKNFTDIAGIRKLLPEIYELVWYLRNSARQFALSKTLPRGVLLTGPPGTGKTLLVQALAGEAQVPVLVLSGSSLIEPGESGAIKLEMLFQEARQLAPCIVFIDEIDTLAQKRSGIVQNPMGPDELLESLSSFEKSATGSPLEFISEFQEKQRIDTQNESLLQFEPKQDQLSLLTQFLIELDGIQGRDGVIVIGATNRPEVLDPAILRPGRFDKVVQVGLPGQQKRIEILKLYGDSLGYQSKITWDYLGQRTAGFTAADLATLMNESTIKAILNQSAHTIETIEHGIDRITTSQSEKYTILKPRLNAGTKNLSCSSKISILRLAYYQAGKVVVSQMLESHPNVLVAYLWPRRTTIRSLQITTNLQNSVFQFARLGELNERIIGSYAGKAAEFLFLESFWKNNSNVTNSNQVVSSQENFVNISTLGLDDLLFAQKLIYCLLEKWSFYSKKFQIQKTIALLSNINAREFAENKEKLEFYNQFIETIQIPPMAQALETQTSSLFSNKENLVPNSNAQMYYSIPWWQHQISSELEFIEKNFANWSRIYLSNPEQSDRNPEWLPPDEFYHSSSGLKNVKIAFNNLSKRKTDKTIKTETAELKQTFGSNDKNVFDDFDENVFSSSNTFSSKSKSPTVEFTWNDVAKMSRDYPAHSLVLQCFNKTLLILNQNRELLDTIVIELLYQEILRQPDLKKLFTDFEKLKAPDKGEQTSSRVANSLKSFDIDSQRKGTSFEQDIKFQILESNWGLESRKKLPRWVDFANFK